MSGYPEHEGAAIEGVITFNDSSVVYGTLSKIYMCWVPCNRVNVQVEDGVTSYDIHDLPVSEDWLKQNAGKNIAIKTCTAVEIIVEADTENETNGPKTARTNAKG